MKKLFRAKEFDLDINKNWQINQEQLREIKHKINSFNIYDIGEEEIDLVCFVLYKLNYIELFDDGTKINLKDF